jgi:hypothetical protein
MREPLLVITGCVVGCHCLKHIMPMFGFQMVYTYQWFGFCGIAITNLYLIFLIVLCRLLCTCYMFASICLLAYCWSKFFYSPTDAQVNCLKSNLKFTLKLTLKQLRHLSVQSHHHQGVHYSCLMRLQLLK